MIDKNGKLEEDISSNNNELTLKSDLKDLQDLYKNLSEENKKLSNENKKITASLLEKQTILDEISIKEANFDKKIIISETEIDYLNNQIDVLLDIINKLIDSR